MSAKYFGQKYADRLVTYYAAKNAVTKLHEAYQALAPQDKVIKAATEACIGVCCSQTMYAFWNTWYSSTWDTDEHLWGGDIFLV